MKVRIAIAPGIQPSTDPDAFAALVDGLEARGFDTIWLSDVPMVDVTDPIVGLSFAAARTTKLKLGANVVPIGRNPMLLAKELAQLDRLCHGRLLLSIVTGLDQPGESAALGLVGTRGSYLDEVLPLLRAWWAGETVTHSSARFDFPGVAVRPTPVQEPLELWLGGIGPKALERVGRLGDGWLGAAMGPEQAGDAVRRINESAAACGRSIDPEHHGLSLAYARSPLDHVVVPSGTRRLNPDVDPRDLVPVGRDALRSLLGRYVEAGVSKFVLRPAAAVASWDDELDWLADAVVDLQT